MLFHLAKRRIEFSHKCLDSIPNMEGAVHSRQWVDDSNPTGVFSTSQDEGADSQSVNSTKGITIRFSANDGNSIYSGDKMQIAALQCLFCIKT